MSVIGRLLALFAVLVMPLGMAPAEASPIDHHVVMAATAMEHCPDQPGKHEHKDGPAMCSMVCASALPAQGVARDETRTRDHQIVIPMRAQRLPGILLEIDTPPPKFA